MQVEDKRLCKIVYHQFSFITHYLFATEDPSGLSAIIIQHIVTMSKYDHSALNNDSSCVLHRYPAIYVILFVVEKNGSFSSFYFQ